MIQFIPLVVGGGVVVAATVTFGKRRNNEKPLMAVLQGNALPNRARPETRVHINGADGISHKVESTAEPGSKHWAEGIRATLYRIDARYQHFMHRHFDRLFGAERDQQMQEISEVGGGLHLSPYEKQLNRNIATSTAITTIALAAASQPILVVITCLPAAIYVSWIIFERAWHNIFVEHKLKLPVVGSVNVLATWLGGFYFAGGLGFVLYFLGEKLVVISQDRSQRKMINIFGQQPRTVWALIDGTEVEIPFEQVEVDTIIVISAGQMIPVDGLITEGYASIDQHRLTGESQPAEKRTGDAVLAATVVLAGKIYVQVSKAGKETAAAQIGEILNTTAGYQMSIESNALQLANASLWPTLLAAGLAWLVKSFEAAVAITNASFGFNIKLTGPIAMLNYLNIAASKGILIKDGRSLELLHTIDTVIFDKTGTLTLEQPHVARIHLFNGIDEYTLLAYAAAVEERQSHPIARAIVTAAKEAGLTPPKINDASYEVGYGIRAHIEESLIRIGSDRFMALEQIALPPGVTELQSVAHGQGRSLVMVALGDQLAGIIELEPTLRPEVETIIQDLHRRDKEVYIISGDQEEPTRRLAERLGIDHYFANTLPEDKAGHVERLQAAGRTVCFVGDGINDSIALKKAQVSVSLRGATSVATDTAQVVLMDMTLNHLPTLFDLAAQFDTNMKLGFAAAIIPGFFIIGGVFLINLGIVGSLAVYNVSLLTGIGVAMLPLLQQSSRNKQVTDRRTK
jgi:Cu2+-exporting ATPase